MANPFVGEKRHFDGNRQFRQYQFYPQSENAPTCIKQGKYRLITTGNDQIGRASFYVVKWSDVADLEMNLDELKQLFDHCHTY